MKLELITPPATYPCTVDELREHLWTIYDGTMDGYLETLLSAATSHVETVTGRKLVSQQWRLYLDAWPAASDAICLPFGRAVSVDQFNWLDAGGDDHELASGEDYLPAVVGPEPQVINLAGWPAGSLFPVDPIRVLFTAGFGEPAKVPKELFHAIRLLAAHWYEIRESVITGTIINTVPQGFEDLIRPWKMRHV